MAVRRVILVPPTAPDFLDVVTQNLVANAKRGEEASLDLFSLRTRALRLVNQDALLPMVEED